MSLQRTKGTESLVAVERRGSAGVLTLNRPRVLNALNHVMVLDLTQALNRWAEDDAVATVVIRGAGDRGLCAGGDIIAVRRDALTAGGTASEKFLRDEYALNALIGNYPKPYVALMDGFVLGGGVGLSAHGSHRVVTERTKIGMPETKIGFIPDVGATWLLSRAPRQLGTFLALTGAHVDGADAIAAGLADYYVPSHALPRLTHLLTERPVADAIAEVALTPPTSRLASWSWIAEAFSAANVTDIVEALRERPEPEARRTAEDMLRRSPTALVLTMRALRAAREMTRLEEALAQEFRIGRLLLRGHDFAEGIRAQVIDKDHSPRWQPKTLNDVDLKWVDAVFEDTT